MKPKTHQDDIRFTVMESGGEYLHPLCKKFTSTSEGIQKQSYQNQYLFTWLDFVAEDFDDLTRVLQFLEAESYACVVLGQVNPDAPELIRRLKYDDVDRSGAVNKAWIWDVPTRVVHFDFDDLELPAWLDWSTPELAAAFVVEHLTDQLGILNDVSFFWQASSSAAVGGCRLAKMHIWMVADTALDGRQRKALYKSAGADDAISSSVHIQYTAVPMFSEMEDPLVKRSGVIKGRMDNLPVSEIMSDLEAVVPASVTLVDVTAEHLVQIGDLGSREKAILFKRLRQIKDSFYRNCVPGNRNNALNQAAFQIGTLAHFEIISAESELADLGAYAVSQGHAAQRTTSAIRSGYNSGRSKIFQIHPPRAPMDIRSKVLNRRAKMQANRKAKSKASKDEEHA